MTGPVPTFVIAGAARAGSTAVVESLRRRAEVFVTQPKEPHYLALGERPAAFTGPGDDLTINEVAVTDRRAYLDLYPEDGGYQAYGEGSVSSLYYHDRAVPVLRELNPSAKIVLVLREPVSRAYSSHQYLLNRGYEPLPDFRAAVEQEDDRVAAGWHHLWHYLRMSRYAEAVSAFQAAFPGAVGVWWYDDLIGAEETTLAEIHEFVGLSPEASEALSVGRVNASGVPRRRWVQAAMHTASRSSTLRSVVKALVPFETRERIRGGNLIANDVPSDLHKEFAPRFRTDLDELERVLGRPVPPSWRR